MQKVRVKRKGRERFKGCLLLASGASGDSLKCPPGLTSAAIASAALASLLVLLLVLLAAGDTLKCPLLLQPFPGHDAGGGNPSGDDEIAVLFIVKWQS